MGTATVVKPLDGAKGYLRWKESMLLRLHTAGVAYVLSDDPPPPPAAAGVKEDCEAAATARRKWARDDAVCRGHILAALSDRIFPDYVRHGTARAAWEAVARTYDVHAYRVARRMFYDLTFDDGAPLLEQIAHAEALNAAMRFTLSDGDLADTLCQILPQTWPCRPSRAREPAARPCTTSGTSPGSWRRIAFPEKIRSSMASECRGCGEPRHHGCNCMG
ncbi:hypothetical protein E2562_013342 [Oryza meyeriana var. granulata]|uniref:Retrotransposon Copia-like N-terminal domain-containing protein n=1 Tax=Oryza meyeriana var. granulata TaxID=110450 RepID=A0A6G1CG26_9ORYZ|nr:hypothetical protein E2562_013342 [Oryza meyeriana var. granulata]